MAAADSSARGLDQPGPRSAPARWLLPEWGRWIRDWSDLLRLSFLVGAIPLIWLDPPEALRLFLTFVVALIPRLMAAPAPFDLGFNFAMSLQAWGNVSNAFNIWLPYHDIVHFVLTGASGALVYFVLLRLRLMPDLSRESGIHQQLGVLLIGMALGTTVNAIYEEYEWFAINVLGSSITEYYQHDVNDLFFGSLGSLTIGLFLAYWARRRWPTRRADVHDDPFAGPLRWIERRMERTVGEEARSRSFAGRRRARLGHLDRGDRPVPRPHLPRVIAGDWTPLVRDVADLLRLSFFVGIWVALAQGETQLAVRFAVTFVAAVAARAIDVPRPFDLLFGVAMAFQAWGNAAGAFPRLAVYEQWTHFAVAMSIGALAYLAFVRFRVLPDFADEPGVHRRVAIFITAMCLGFCSGVYYELYVWFANHALGANFATSWDRLTVRLGLDWLGGAAAGVLLVAWDVWGWGARRRLEPATLSGASPAPAG